MALTQAQIDQMVRDGFSGSQADADWQDRNKQMDKQLEQAAKDKPVDGDV